MDPKEVLEALRAKGVTHLHHANTVTTSCTLLEQGGLASRGFVEDRGLAQTAQYTDHYDKSYGIWHDVFVDSVDIHDRAGMRNWYGPVLFVLPVDIVATLPAGSTVRVTRTNPTKWYSGQPDSERYFLTRADLDADFTKGTFGQMVVIRTKDGIVKFRATVNIVLDDPQRATKSGTDLYDRARERLTESADTGGVNMVLKKRTCRNTCGCLHENAKGKRQYRGLPYKSDDLVNLRHLFK